MLDRAESDVPAAAGRQAEDLAPLGLLELVAVYLGRVQVDRMLEEEGEVRKQVELRLDRIGVQAKLAVVHASHCLVRQAVALGATPVAGVDGAEAADQARVDRALRDLVGRVPAGRVPHRSDRGAVGVVAERVAENAIGCDGTSPGSPKDRCCARPPARRSACRRRALVFATSAARIAILAERHGRHARAASASKSSMRADPADEKSPSSAKYGPLR